MPDTVRRSDAPMEARATVEQRWEAALEGDGLDLKVAGDGSLVAVGESLAGGGAVALLDRGGKQLWRYVTREPIRHVAVSDVGGFVAGGCDDSQVYFFDRRGLLLWRYKCDQRIRALSVSRDGNVLACGSEDQGVYYFDNRNTPRRFVWKLRMEGMVNAVVMVPSGENVLAGAGDGGIYFMDAREGSVLWKAFARAPVLSVAASKFGDVMAAGSEDGSLHCFDFGGRLMWERQTAGAVVDVSVDNRGAFVAALSKDGALYFFDAKTGALLWSHPTGSDGGLVRLTKNGDLVFVATADDHILCLSADEGLIFDALAGGEAAALELTADSETVLLLEGRHVRAFDTKSVFKSLILSLRPIILASREKGSEIEPALAFEKQAVAALKNFDYKGVHTAVLSAEAVMREGQLKLSEDSHVQRMAAEAISKLKATLQLGQEAGFDVGAVRNIVAAAEKLAAAGEFGKALSTVTDARGKVQDLERRKDGMEKAKRAVLAAREAIEASKRFEGVATGDAAQQLALADAAMAERDFTMAGEFAALAAEMAVQARRASPKAVEAEMRDLQAKVAAGPLGGADRAAAEAVLASAAAHYQGRHAFKEYAATMELAAHIAGSNGSTGDVPHAARLALEAAAFAYLDAGEPQKAATTAERAGEVRLAAKLRERAKERGEAERIVAWIAAENRERREAAAAEARKLDDYIGGLVSARRFGEAAAELVKFERFSEAAALLEGHRDPMNAALLLRIYFHRGDWGKLMATCAAVEASLRDEIAKGANELLPFLGRLIVGHAFVAQVLSAPGEQDRLNDLTSFFLMAYERRAGVQGERDLDASAFAAMIARGERDKVRKAASARKGPFFEWVADAEVMIERGNQKGFKKMLALYARDFVARYSHMGSGVKGLLPPSSAEDALDELFPFNVNAQLAEAYRVTLNQGLFERLVATGDALAQRGELEKAAPFWRDTLARDGFGLVPRPAVAGRLASVYLKRGDRDGAARVAKEAGVEAEVATREARKLPWGQDLGAIAPEGSAQQAMAPRPQADGKKCGSCGEFIPRVAVRCYKCGEPVR